VHENRFARRVSLHTRAIVQTRNERLDCQVVNVSVRGMALETQRPVVRPLFVRIHTVLDDSLDPIDVDAIVTREEPRSDGARWGVEFHDLPLHVLRKIRACVGHRLGETSRPHSTPISPEQAVTRPQATSGGYEPVSSNAPSSGPSPSLPDLERLYEAALSAIGRS